MTEDLGPIKAAADAAATDLEERNALARLRARDHTLWQDDPTEVADRLGWLDCPDTGPDVLDDLAGFAAAAADDGFTHAVLMGMGGSSLFPEVLARTFGAAPGRLQVRVLDTTDPAAVRRQEAELPLDRTLFVAASKSGTTIETSCHLAYFWHVIGRGEQFAVITDPGTPLAELADQRSFRRVFTADPDIGGRYSALSLFGLVPGALLGVDLAALLQRARRVAQDLGPALRLGAAIGAGAKAGRDKLTFVLPPAVATFGLWLEQLLAESTGKHGTGVLPVVGEDLGPPAVYGDDRVFVGLGSHAALADLAAAGHPVVELPFAVPADIGHEVLRWEVATALCGAVLGINPFDQPNVASAKDATARVLADGLPDVAHEPVDRVLATVRPGDYVAIQAYVDPAGDAVPALQRVRIALRDRLAVATTLGLGPRYLHSTGQLHKGGPPTGVFLQVVGDDPEELDVPGRPWGFSTLKRAQAAGDLTALRAAGLRAARVSLDELLEVGA